MCVLALGTHGKMLASATRRFSTPSTRPCSSTTVPGSPGSAHPAGAADVGRVVDSSPARTRSARPRQAAFRLAPADRHPRRNSGWPAQRRRRDRAAPAGGQLGQVPGQREHPARGPVRLRDAERRAPPAGRRGVVGGLDAPATKHPRRRACAAARRRGAYAFRAHVRHGVHARRHGARGPAAAIADPGQAVHEPEKRMAMDSEGAAHAVTLSAFELDSHRGHGRGLRTRCSSAGACAPRGARRTTAASRAPTSRSPTCAQGRRADVLPLGGRPAADRGRVGVRRAPGAGSSATSRGATCTTRTSPTTGAGGRPPGRDRRLRAARARRLVPGRRDAARPARHGRQRGRVGRRRARDRRRGPPGRLWRRPEWTPAPAAPGRSTSSAAARSWTLRSSLRGAARTTIGPAPRVGAASAAPRTSHEDRSLLRPAPALARGRARAPLPQQAPHRLGATCA